MLQNVQYLISLDMCSLHHLVGVYGTLNCTFRYLELIFLRQDCGNMKNRINEITTPMKTSSHIVQF